MPRKVLFICGKNKLRSPTAEQIFANWPGIGTSSAGLSSDSDVPVSIDLLQWAELIFVMEPAHRSKLSARFGPHLGHAKVICLDIPDNYEFMDPRLIEILQARVAPHLMSR